MTDPVVAKAHRNLGGWVAYLALAVATAGGIWGFTAKQQSERTARTVEAARPCVDANGGERGVRPSAGCRAVFRLLTVFCVQNPKFCRESQQRAVKAANRMAIRQEIGPVADTGARGGGGDSRGNNPNSQPSPSPDPGGGGQGDGGQQGSGSTATPQPQPEPQPTTPDPPVTVPPSVPDVTQQVCTWVAGLLGPVLVCR